MTACGSMPLNRVLPCLLLVLLTCPCRVPAGIPAYDANQDWLSGISAQGVNGCDIAPQPKGRPLPTMQTPQPGSITVDQIIQQAWKLAPKLYMHPLEWSHLSDPVNWIATTPIYEPQNLTVQSVGPVLNTTTLRSEFLFLSVMGARTFTSHIFPDGFKPGMPPISTATLKQRVYGDPTDAKGYSTAKVYYNAMDMVDSYDPPKEYTRGQAVMIKFHYFYPFNGCSNQVLALNINSKFQGIEYYMCNPGIHEGDWEHMSFLVSVANWSDADPANAITRVQYSQHSWNAQYDCNLGECQFEIDETGMRRLVAFAGLYSHAMYPTASPLHVYMKVAADMLLNIDGVYIGDRTMKGGAVFLPTANNTLFLPALNNLTREQATGDLAWAAYPGSWGGYLVAEGKGSPVVSVTCFSSNFTVQGLCPASNPATAYIDYFLSLKWTVTTVNDFLWYSIVSAPFTVSAITGPLYRTYSYEWEREGSAPLYSSGLVNVTCPFSGSPTRAAEYPTSYSQPNIAGLVLGLAGLLIGTGILFMLAMCFPGLGTRTELKAVVMRLSNQGQNGSAANLPKDDEAPASTSDTADNENMFSAWRSLVWMGLALAVYITGAVLSVMGIQTVFTALSDIYDLAVYEPLEQAFKAVLVIFGSWQIIVVLCVLFIRTQEKVRCFCYISNPCSRWTSVGHWGYILHIILAGVLVITINATMLLFAFGFLMTVLQMLFQISCNSVLEKLFSQTNLGYICLDLNSIGIDKVMCGNQLTQTCGLWEGLDIVFLPYGCLLLALSHVLFLVLSVHQTVSLRSNWLLAGFKSSGTWKAEKRGGCFGSKAKAQEQADHLNGAGSVQAHVTPHVEPVPTRDATGLQAAASMHKVC